MMRSFPLAALLAALVPALCAVACGGSNSPGATGSATVSGTLAGTAYAAADAVSANSTLLGVPVTAVGISTVVGYCAASSVHADQKNSRSLAWVLVDKGASGNNYTTVSGPGTYPIYDIGGSNFPSTGKYAFGTWDNYDATCTDTSTNFTTAGSVIITGVDGSGSLTGSFDTTTAAGDHVTGTFKTGNCSISPSDGGSRVCQ